MRLIIFFLFVFLTRPCFAISTSEVELKTNTVVSQVLKQQRSVGQWESLLQSDPSWDVVLMVLGKKLNQPYADLFPNLKTRLISWKGKQAAWGPTPGALPTVDVTGIILLGLRELGVTESDPLVACAWKWFNQANGLKRISPMTKLVLYPLGLNELSLPVSTSFFSFSDLSPINIHNIGVIRLQLIPLLVFDYYHQAGQHGVTVNSLDPERLKSNGAAFTDLKYALSGDDFWAQEGLGWLVGHQQQDGPWYIFQASAVSLLALHEAQMTGVHDFSKEIALGWQGLRSWIRHDPTTGDDFISPTLSEGWDTPLVTVSLLKLPSRMRSAEITSALEKAQQWMVATQPKVRGDWTYLAPDLRPGGWSFFASNPTYPDTDCTAAALNALTIARENGIVVKGANAAARKGLAWLLGMQNLDGGWAAWDRGVSHVFGMLENLFAHIDAVDTGQVDLTSRVLQMLVHLKNQRFIASSDKFSIETAIQRGCSYIKSNALAYPVMHWSGDWATNYVYATGSAAGALLQTQCWSLEDAKASLNWLVEKQNPDGGWGESSESFTSSDYVRGPSTISQSGTPLLALIAYERLFESEYRKPSAFRAAIDKGVTYLLSRIDSRGFPSEHSYSGVMVKGYWYIDYSLGPQWLGLDVLDEYLQLPQQR